MDKREQILVSAVKLFVERGFHGTPTSAITRDAGVSAGILFHYFPTKEHLVTELLVEIKLEFFGAAFANLHKIKSYEGRLRLLWSNAWKWGTENPVRFKYLQQADNSTFHDMATRDEEVNALYQADENFIGEGIRIGFIKNFSTELLLANSFSLITTMVQFLMNNPEMKNDTSFVEQSWESFVDCLKR